MLKCLFVWFTFTSDSNTMLQSNEMLQDLYCLLFLHLSHELHKAVFCFCIWLDSVLVGQSKVLEKSKFDAVHVFSSKS